MRKQSITLRRNRGMSIIYVIVSMSVLMGFCSLAVDLGRVVTTKTELRRAADAAAREAAYEVLLLNPAPATGATLSTPSTTKAIAIAALNQANGAAVTLTASNFSFGTWNSSTHVFSTSASVNPTGGVYFAVKVTANCTSANSNAVPLVFGQIIGASTCDVSATSIAEVYQTTPPQTYSSSGGSSNPALKATSDPWLAGATATDSTTVSSTAGKSGTASAPDQGYVNTTDHQWKYDVANPANYGKTMSTKEYTTDNATGQPYGSPLQIGSSGGGQVNGINTLAINPGDIITISSVSGTATNDNASSNTYTANGYNGGVAPGTGNAYANTDNSADTSGSSWTDVNGSTHSGYSQGGPTSENGIANVSAPLNSAIGVFLDNNDPVTYSHTAPAGEDYTTQTERDYNSVSPKLWQPFYVGTGQTSSSVQQTIIVPSNATRFFLGTMDGHEWSNNSGGYNLTATQNRIVLVQ